MTVISEVEVATVPAEQVTALAGFVSSLAESGLRDLLLSLSASLKNGLDVSLFESDGELTPAQAAARLKMSRTHLYKLLDRGEIVSHHIGRDRRIRMSDLICFEQTRQSDRRELAERFAHMHATRASAIDELTDEL